MKMPTPKTSIVKTCRNAYRKNVARGGAEVSTDGDNSGLSEPMG